MEALTISMIEFKNNSKQVRVNLNVTIQHVFCW